MREKSQKRLVRLTAGTKLTVYRLESCCNWLSVTYPPIQFVYIRAQAITQYLVERKSIMLCMHNSMLFTLPKRFSSFFCVTLLDDADKIVI